MSTYGTFLDLKEQACELSQRSSSNATYLALAGKAVNNHYLQLMRGTDQWSFAIVDGQVTLTAGTADYLVNGASSVSSTLGYGTDGVEELLRVVIDSESASGRPLARMPWVALEELASSTQDNDPQGPPVAWSVVGDRLRLWPTPDEAFTVGVLLRRRAAALSGDTDEPLVPEGFRHGVLVKLAAADLLHREGGAEARSEAGQLRSEAMQAVQDMRVRYASARDASDFRLVSPVFADGADGGWPSDGGV